MKMRNPQLCRILALAAVFGFAVHHLQAGPPPPAEMIEGLVFFSGTSGLDAPIATATEYLFFSNVTVSAFKTGDYASVPTGTAVTMTPFQFDPVLLPNPVAPLWTFDVGGDTYAFNFTSPISVARDTSNAINELTISGAGQLSITGFLPTPGEYILTTQGNTTEVTFSGATVAIPEPSRVLLALLGFGLVTLRRQR